MQFMVHDYLLASHINRQPRWGDVCEGFITNIARPNHFTIHRESAQDVITPITGFTALRTGLSDEAHVPRTRAH